MVTRCLRATALFALILLAEGASHAYPTPTDYRGQLKRWPITIDQPEITYRIEAPEGFVAEHRMFTERAAEMWTEVAGSYIHLVEIEDEGEEQITVVLTEQFSGNSRSGGFAIFDRWTDDGPSHCRIEIPVVFPMRSGFPRTVLHELGHCIGLGHSLVPESVMSYNLAKSGFRLATDDRAGAAQLYPADGSAPAMPLGCGVVLGKKHGKHSGKNSLFSVGTGILAACHLVILLFGLQGLRQRPTLTNKRES